MLRKGDRELSVYTRASVDWEIKLLLCFLLAYVFVGYTSFSQSIILFWYTMFSSV